MVGEGCVVHFDIVVFDMLIMLIMFVLCSGLNRGRHRDSASLYRSVSMNSSQRMSNNNPD